MSRTEALELAQVAVGLFVLAVAYFYCYRKTRLDAFRDDLFQIRDELFDWMVLHDRSYDSPGYRELRSVINGFIRFAHLFEVWSLILIAWAARPLPAGGRIKQAIDEVEDEALKAHLQAVYQRVANRVFRYIFAEGFASLVFYPTYLAVKHSQATLLRRRFRFASVADRAAQVGRYGDSYRPNGGVGDFGRPMAATGA